MFLTTKEGGQTMAFPNVCKVPSAPAPFIPTPFPSIGMCANASASTCTTRVTVANKAVLHVGSEISSTSGDEAGTLKGLVSPMQGSTCKRIMGSVKVEMEGQYVVMDLLPISSNGDSPNAPVGTQIVPSQSKVLVMC